MFYFFVNRSVFAVIASAVIVGQMFSMTPDYTKAREATNKVFSFLEKIPSIDSFSDRGEQPVSSHSRFLSIIYWVYNLVLNSYYQNFPCRPLAMGMYDSRMLGLDILLGGS
jgi:hypothetical protein